jgi:hypothetical protein
MTRAAALAVREAKAVHSTMGLPAGFTKAFVRSGELHGTLIFDVDGNLASWAQQPESRNYTDIKAALVERLGPPTSEIPPEHGGGVAESLWTSKECGVSVKGTFRPTPFGSVTTVVLSRYALPSLD